MTSRGWRGRLSARGFAGMLALAATSVWAAGPSKTAAQPPELPAETLVGSTLAGATTERIYVADVAIAHIVDSRLRVFDARAGKLLGLINTGYAGNFALSGTADEIYIATTYLSRGGRGERSDILEVWDAQTLGFKYELMLSTKRAQTLNYRGMVRPTANGRFVLVQNATPATSITVVDLVEREVATEVATPGCWPTSSPGPSRKTTRGDSSSRRNEGGPGVPRGHGPSRQPARPRRYLTAS